jgi:hypothetical protein
MRSAITMLILTLGLGLILFLKITSENVLTEHKYTGNETCRPCHSVQMRGNQYEIWKRSAHAQATDILKDEKALKYAEQNKQKKPLENETCLNCHITAFGEKEDKFENTFNRFGGIQCEECHNPGSEYSKFEVMISKSSFKSSGGETGNKIHCFKCHSPNMKNKDFNKCPFQKENFNYDKAFVRIKHSVHG